MIKSFRIINLVFFIVMIALNALANILPLGHGNTGAISAKYPNLFTPAPVTFAIWGVIYILVGFFTLFQMGWFGSRVLTDSIIDIIGPWFMVSCVMNICWLLTWHYEQIGLSVLFIIGLLFSLIIISLMLTPDAIRDATGLAKIPFAANVCIWAFDIYLGWITAATIANMSVLLVKINWSRFGLPEQLWTVVILLVGAALGVLFIMTREKFLSAAAIIWAYCGILIKHISQSGHAGKYPLIIAVAIVGIVLILSAAVLKLVFKVKATA